VNCLVASLIAVGLFRLDGEIVRSLPPPPKDPPTATENAAAVVALEKQQGLIAVPSEPSRAVSTPKRQSAVPPKKPTEQPSPSGPAPMLQVADLMVSQTQDVSTDNNNPIKTSVVVQTTKTFESLSLALECDGPIDHGMAGFAGMMVNVHEGVISGHPNVFVFAYSASTPQFGPGNPLHINLWSKDVIHCDKASTF
jgi:hypothetical protein